ncbi:hypothetical protein ACHAXN_004258 [Cyclotella atomus]
MKPVMMGASHFKVGAQVRFAMTKKKITNDLMNSVYDAGILVPLILRHAPKFKFNSHKLCSIEISIPLSISGGNSHSSWQSASNMIRRIISRRVASKHTLASIRKDNAVCQELVYQIFINEPIASLTRNAHACTCHSSPLSSSLPPPVVTSLSTEHQCKAEKGSKDRYS